MIIWNLLFSFKIVRKQEKKSRKEASKNYLMNHMLFVIDILRYILFIPKRCFYNIYKYLTVCFYSYLSFFVIFRVFFQWFMIYFFFLCIIIKICSSKQLKKSKKTSYLTYRGEPNCVIMSNESNDWSWAIFHRYTGPNPSLK